MALNAPVSTHQGTTTPETPKPFLERVKSVLKDPKGELNNAMFPPRSKFNFGAEERRNVQPDALVGSPLDFPAFLSDGAGSLVNVVSGGTKLVMGQKPTGEEIFTLAAVAVPIARSIKIDPSVVTFVNETELMLSKANELMARVRVNIPGAEMKGDFKIPKKIIERATEYAKKMTGEGADKVQELMAEKLEYFRRLVGSRNPSVQMAILREMDTKGGHTGPRDLIVEIGSPFK
jgi:hypothetical protein